MQARPTNALSETERYFGGSPCGSMCEGTTGPRPVISFSNNKNKKNNTNYLLCSLIVRKGEACA